MFHRIAKLASCAALLLVLIAPTASAQEVDAKSLLNELGHRHAALASLSSLERLAARIVHVESVALLSDHGDWPEELHNWQSENGIPKFFYDVNNIYGRFEPERIALLRAASRSGTFSDEEHARFTSLLDDFAVLIDGSRTFYDLLATGQTTEASVFFRDSIRPPYQSIVEGSFTLSSGVSSDISKIMLKARLVK